MAARDGIWRRDGSATRFLLCMRQYVGLQVCRLRKLLVATLQNTNMRKQLSVWKKCQNLKGADVGAVSRVYAHVCPQVEVEGESLSTALKSALERLFPSVNQLMSFQSVPLYKSLSTFGTNMYPGKKG